VARELKIAVSRGFGFGDALATFAAANHPAPHLVTTMRARDCVGVIGVAIHFNTP
jgi:hypothetical protein